MAIITKLVKLQVPGCCIIFPDACTKDSYFKKQINIIGEKIFKYSEIYFHLILFPVPNKDKIVNEFIEEAGFYQKK